MPPVFLWRHPPFPHARMASAAGSPPIRPRLRWRRRPLLFWNLHLGHPLGPKRHIVILAGAGLALELFQALVAGRGRLYAHAVLDRPAAAAGWGGGYGLKLPVLGRRRLGLGRIGRLGQGQARSQSGQQDGDGDFHGVFPFALTRNVLGLRLTSPNGNPVGACQTRTGAIRRYRRPNRPKNVTALSLAEAVTGTDNAPSNPPGYGDDGHPCLPLHRMRQDHKPHRLQGTAVGRRLVVPPMLQHDRGF